MTNRTKKLAIVFVIKKIINFDIDSMKLNVQHLCKDCGYCFNHNLQMKLTRIIMKTL